MLSLLREAHPERVKVTPPKPRVRVKARYRRIVPPPQIKTSNDLHPIVANLFAELNGIGMSLGRACESAGVNYTTAKYWRTNSPEVIEKLDAMYRILGYKLSVSKLEEGAAG